MSRNPRLTRFVLFFAFVASALILGLLPMIIMSNPGTARPPDPTAARPIIYGLAGLALLMAAGTALLRLTRAATAAQFLTMMILALALAQACSIFGLLLFLIGGPASEVIRFIVATITVEILFILPQIVSRMA